MSSSLRPTHAVIDLDAIAQNIRLLSAQAPDAAFMAVVKADGYGHGALPVTRTALQNGAAWLGVATVEEGVQIREANIDAPILVLGYVGEGQAPTVAAHRLTPAIFHLELAYALAIYGQEQPVRVHLKVDTGMGRVGVQPEQAVDFARTLMELPGIELDGIFTHLATADEPENPFAAKQLARFQQVLAELEAAGIKPRWRHACNSAATMLHPQSHLDVVRAGIAMYGLPPDPAVAWPVDLKPALTWKTRVGLVKTVEPGTSISYGATYHATMTERVASLPIGYADGYSRSLSNKGQVLIGGRRCPIIGRVCMDQMMVRLPDDLTVNVGDEVVLIGRQGAEEISASEMAGWIGTINYEVVCTISKRVPRIYVTRETLP